MKRVNIKLLVAMGVWILGQIAAAQCPNLHSVVCIGRDGGKMTVSQIKTVDGVTVYGFNMGLSYIADGTERKYVPSSDVMIILPLMIRYVKNPSIFYVAECSEKTLKITQEVIGESDALEGIYYRTFSNVTVTQSESTFSLTEEKLDAKGNILNTFLTGGNLSCSLPPHTNNPDN